jgi:thymidylate synthase (FAD)
MMRQLIKDPFFRVEIDLNASSPCPEKAIWTAQHVCVSDGFAPLAVIPDEPGEAIIKHQLGVKHWSVLEFAYVVLHFGGFPHDTAMQLVRHQDSKPLVQSMRYTGDKMRRCGNGEFETEELFYVQPAGVYSTRTGSYSYTESSRQEDLNECRLSAVAYSRTLAKGHPEESARRLLCAGYRQNFVMAGTVRSVMHWLDQRTLADSQIEAQTLAWMAFEKLRGWSPALFEWYEQNRAGKNLLAP